MSPFDCWPLMATSVNPHRDRQTGKQMLDSQCAVKLKKKEINDLEDLQEHLRTARKRHKSCDTAGRPASALTLQLFESVMKPRSLAQTDRQTGLLVLQTCLTERDALIGWADNCVQRQGQNQKETRWFFSMPTPDRIQTEPAAGMSQTTRAMWTRLKTYNYSLFQWFQPVWIWSRAQQVNSVAHPRRTLISHESALNGTTNHHLSDRVKTLRP